MKVLHIPSGKIFNWDMFFDLKKLYSHSNLDPLSNHRRYWLARELGIIEFIPQPPNFSSSLYFDDMLYYSKWIIENTSIEEFEVLDD